MRTAPTLLGHVGSVSGASITVKQAPSVASGIAIIGGKTYRIGQVGSYVRVPQGYHDLYGVVAEVGAAAPRLPAGARADDSDRWMTVQLVGEVMGAAFERGISQYPNVADEVHIATEEDLALIYRAERAGQIAIGRFASAEGIPVCIDLEKLVTRHSAVLGSTGSGKSTTVASLLRSITGTHRRGTGPYPSSRILLLDMHGEYGGALGDVARVFRISPTGDELPLCIPYWALEPREVLSFLLGRLDDKASTQVLDRVLALKVRTAQASKPDGVDLTSLTTDSPIPYSLKQLWYELIEPEVRTWLDPARTQPALIAQGDPNQLQPPQYQPATTNNTAPYINNIGVLGIRRPLDQMRSRLLDRQYDFMLHPGPWEPDLDGSSLQGLDDLLAAWLGHDRQITILDLSGVPSSVSDRLIGAILKIVYDALFWGREKSEGGIARPLLVVMEEAHRYLSRDADGPARTMVQRIVKEGRKFGVGAMIVSQRPSEVDETILSQCGTFFALRLSNAADRTKVQGALPDSLAGLVDSLPVLRTGEAVITGEAALLPIRCRVTLPPEGGRPDSEDPQVATNWAKPRVTDCFGRVTASWRAQDPRWTAVRPVREALSQATTVDERGMVMDREPVTSSNVASVGYDDATETLEVEFKNGAIYQYYNVPRAVYDAMLQATSVGQFLNATIKPSYPYSRA